MMPVVHEGEREGGFVVGVHRSDPAFAQVRALWKQRYPQKPRVPTTEVDELDLMGAFATQFPDDSQPPKP